MRNKLLLVILAATVLTGCAAIDRSIGTGTTGTVDMTTLSKEAFAARSAYAVALAAANEIAALPRCGRAPPPCIAQSFINAMRRVDRMADTATLNAEQAVRSLGQNPTAVQVAVTAATASVATFKDVVAAGK